MKMYFCLFEAKKINVLRGYPGQRLTIFVLATETSASFYSKETMKSAKRGEMFWIVACEILILSFGGCSFSNSVPCSYSVQTSSSIRINSEEHGSQVWKGQLGKLRIQLEYTKELTKEDYYWEADLIYNTTKCLNSVLANSRKTYNRPALKNDAIVSPNITDEDMFTPQEIIANSSRRYIEFEGVGSFKLHDQPLDWLFAERVCESEGGHLAVVDSRSKVTSLLDIFSRYPHIPRSSALTNQVYVGITDMRDEGVFYTSTVITAGIRAHDFYVTEKSDKMIRKPVSACLPTRDAGLPFDPRQDQAWLPDEPDDAPPGEDCVTFHTTGKLRDVPCYFELPYICEKGTAL
uniref:C-type lectin domain-containing protein n=1 Tax=Timema genevievae TaxID=629358 RepID=A0A7R9JVD8_TIMGE|nr:unnamed protein product [Timema genevievae]